MLIKSRIVLIVLIFIISVACFSQDASEKLYMNQPQPGDEPVIFYPDKVSYPIMNHSSLTLTPDLKEMYWSKFFEGGAEYTEHLMVSRFEDGKWTEPAETEFSKGYFTDVPFVSPDGKRIYFTAKRPNPLNDTKAKESIWYAERDGDDWGEPIPLPNCINNSQLHWHIAVDLKYNVYYSTDEGMKVSFYVDGEYQEPQQTSEVMRPDYKGGFPYIAPDESYFIFASNDLPGNIGKWDLYIGFKLADGTWSKPVHLGDKINSFQNDLCPIVTPDGKFMFFISTRSGVSNIHWVSASFIETLRPSSE